VGIDEDLQKRTQREKWLSREKQPAKQPAKKSSWRSYWPGICSVCGKRFPKDTRIVTVSERTDDRPGVYRHAGCVPLEPLSDAEQALLERCEAAIEGGMQLATKGVVGAGKALKVVRDKRLYKATDGTFAAWCQRRLDLTPQHVNRLISAHEIAAILEPTGSIPNERQLRELTPLKDRPEHMRLVWESARAASNGRPTAAVVRRFVEQAGKPTVVAGEAEPVDDTPATATAKVEDPAAGYPKLASVPSPAKPASSARWGHHTINDVIDAKNLMREGKTPEPGTTTWEGYRRLQAEGWKPERPKPKIPEEPAEPFRARSLRSLLSMNTLFPPPDGFEVTDDLRPDAEQKRSWLRDLRDSIDGVLTDLDESAEKTPVEEKTPAEEPSIVKTSVASDEVKEFEVDVDCSDEEWEQFEAECARLGVSTADKLGELIARLDLDALDAEIEVDGEGES
jgi:hypothetical protein